MTIRSTMAVLLLGAVATAQVRAADPPPPVVAAAPEKLGSVYVRCDGSPNKASDLGTAARLIAITAVIGLLIPPRETADETKRLSGVEGIKACDEALVGPKAATDAGRRVELILARAIHKIEAGDFDGALADARLPATDQPLLATLPAYKLSLGLSATDVEALALLGAGKTEQAADKALEMAAAAPYDIVNTRRASIYLSLTPRFGPAEAKYYDAATRIEPTTLLSRANLLNQNRKFAEAAADLETFSALLDSIPDNSSQFHKARAGLAYALAGDMARAAKLRTVAETANAADRAAGKAERAVEATAQLFDLWKILDMARGGDIVTARTIFAGRSLWDKIDVGTVAEVARILRAGAKPADLIGQLAVEPDSYWRDEAASRIKLVSAGGEKGVGRYRAFRAQISPNSFAAFANNVWKTDKSKYLLPEETKAWKAQWISTARNGSGQAGAMAMYLHAALMAKAGGKTGFMILPDHRFVYQTHLRIGNPGDPGVLAPITYNADTVIADLSPFIPKPVKAR